MKKIFSLFLIAFAVIFFFDNAFSQNKIENAKVANYSTGKYGTSSYEHFSFWVDDAEKPLEISFSMKNRDKDIIFTYAGKTVDGKGFKVKTPNGATSSIYIVGRNLRVVNGRTKKAKIFKWEYEGPVNAIGTYCTPCVQEDKVSNRLYQEVFSLEIQKI